MAFAPACGTVHPAQFHARIAYVDQDFHGFACCGRTETSPTEMACSPSGVRSSNWPKVFTPQAMPACVMRPSSSTLIRSEEHTSELQSLMRISYAVFCLKKKKQRNQIQIV